ncbi:hypothetical protein H4CHR_00500 [Variovorax sp. PBS-H4]|uniref:hypothetical protein n=1 Tax=Variovorax sp. PBS-H4 TaxID=434008 RepID=UPI001318277D|nr:hypothetical protein [Variovorax sp. PBS-H4]VTU20014.1 hypothetical protein H4CHR_00500 [Variovorax sp. PBS-H4]
MNKMNVVAFKSTSHVLGAATRNAQPDKPMTLDDLAANGIVVRDTANAGLQVLIGKEQLKMALVDYDTRLFYRPQLFAVTEDLQVEQQNEAALPAVALNGSTVSVTLPALTLSDIQVFVHVTGGALTEPAVRAVPIAHNTTVGSAGLVLGAANYTVVILAPGYATRIVAEAVP